MKCAGLSIAGSGHRSSAVTGGATRAKIHFAGGKCVNFFARCDVFPLQIWTVGMCMIGGSAPAVHPIDNFARNDGFRLICRLDRVADTLKVINTDRRTANKITLRPQTVMTRAEEEQNQKQQEEDAYVLFHHSSSKSLSNSLTLSWADS